jgi:CRP-like cAMP-binding protein
LNIVIQKLELRSHLSAQEKDALSRAFSTVRVFEPGQQLMAEDEPAPFVGAVQQGLACRQKTLPDGQRQIVSFLLPGDIADLHSFLLDRMDHSVTAITRCRVAVASRTAIEELATGFPRLGLMLWRDALVEGSVFREWIVNIGSRPATARIAHLICEMFERMGEVGLTEGRSFVLPLTQTVFGEATGLSVVHVNRVLQRLRAGLISFERQRLTIHDWEGLTELAGFHRGYLHIGETRRMQGFASRMPAEPSSALEARA